MSAPAAPLTRWERVKAWFDVRFRSPAAIYGLIVFAAFVTIADDHAETVGEVLESAATSLVVFFIAHVFAHTLTEHATHGLRRATREGMRHGAGMLYASVPSVLLLIYAAVSGMSVDDASDLSMWSTFVVLGVLGYFAYARRGARLVMRLVGAFATACLGIFIVLLEYAVH
ncbi:hypothetical protein DBR36_13445 [Microbacterium sp. HMWF026]|uniref:hypothetical protein n=1 Tax=Microbacterium sp. HMWF026 TaxID=2056861 RepID=UPI000D3C35F0|nr:hypothetical protein [Microbacterium sp. HMWF026]PTT16183.1 hypothetical protein DBR36_13445 [Microbacterium sp. HMWF026]